MNNIYIEFGDVYLTVTLQEIILTILVFILISFIIYLFFKLDFKNKQKILNPIKCVFAYILGIIGWLIGVIIGVVYSILYGGYQDTQTIDISVILMENIIPALISVNLSNYIFNKIFPETSYKNINVIIFYIILFLNYGIVLYKNLYIHNYSSIIYVLTGIITLIYFINKLLNSNKK